MSPERPNNETVGGIPKQDITSPDFYVRLGVNRNASPEEIESAYRRLAKKYHPDKPEGDAQSFRDLKEARDGALNPSGIRQEPIKAERKKSPPIAEPYEGGPDKLWQDFLSWQESFYKLQDNPEQPGGVFCAAFGYSPNFGNVFEGANLEWDGNDVESIASAASNYKKPPGMVETFASPPHKIEDPPYDEYPYSYRVARYFRVTLELSQLIKDRG